MQTYGYSSEGESFSLGDPKEVWIMEVIGKGNYSRGSVWAAQRVPDGYVCAHANQARIRKFPRDRPDDALFSRAVVDFAKKIGVYSGPDEDFSFSDVYDPVTFLGARACEARVYSFFSAVAAADEKIDDYLDYVSGHNLTHRMPLFVKVDRKLTVNDTMWHMRNHYEGTWLDPRKDVGAGDWALPNRFTSLQWSYGGADYVNERPIGVQYAGWNFVGVQRPNHRHSIIWFGADDSTFSIRAPFYGATNRVPLAWDDANCTGQTACRERNGLPGTRTKFSMKSQHWIQNMIANHAYSRFSEIAPRVQQRLVEIERGLFQDVSDMDAKLDAMDDAKEAAEAATDFSFRTAERLYDEAVELYGEIFVSSVDGFHLKTDPSNAQCGCKTEYPEWGEEWKKRIATETGDHYKIPKLTSRPDVTPKTRLRALGGPGTAPCRKTPSEAGAGTTEMLVV